MADQQTILSNIRELYSVPIKGPATSWIKLNGSLVADGNVFDYLISPDSSRVVYRADQEINNVLELYSVPIAGPAASGIKLNAPLVAAGNVSDYLISPDSGRVVYLADQQIDNIMELYSVSIGGPSASGIKLNGALVKSGNVQLFRISPDSSRVVYQADQQTATIFELYSVPIKGPATFGIKVNGALVAGGNVSNYLISPDSSRVLYMADQDTDGVFELYMTSNYLIHLPLILRQG